MSNIPFVLLAILGGCMFAIQATVNGAFGKRIGIYESSLVSVLISFVILLIVVLLFGKGNLYSVSEVPKWNLLGGVLGAFIVITMVVTVPRVGAASAVFGAMFGQVIISVLIDNFGFFDVPVIKIDAFRFTGVLFMLIGLILIFKGHINFNLSDIFNR